MNKIEASLIELISGNSGASLSSDYIIKKLKEKKLKGVNRLKVGLLMKKWGFKSERIMVEGRKIRSYYLQEWKVKALRQGVPGAKSQKRMFAKKIAFWCGYNLNHYQGFYILRPDETLSKDRKHIISKEYPQGRYCLCPICHPPGSRIGPDEGLHVAFAHKDEKNFRKKDGPISFWDQIHEGSGALGKGSSSFQSLPSDYLSGGGLYGGKY